MDAQSGHAGCAGGHGVDPRKYAVLACKLTLPETYRAFSAVSPLANLPGTDWGYRQFAAYRGEDLSTWTPHDANELAKVI